MNIFRVARINIEALQSVLFFDTYEVSSDEYWDSVAWKIYNMPQLWWIVGLMNNTVNPFEELSPGDLLTVLKEEYVYALTKDMEGIAE